MPTYTFTGGTGAGGFDMRLWGANTIIGVVSSNFSSSRTSTEVVYPTGGGNGLIAYGTFLSFNEFGDPTSGVVTGFTHVQISLGETFSAFVSGLNIDVATLFNWILPPPPQGAQDIPLQFALFGGADTITGTIGNDYLYGYGGADNISGGDGADEIHGDTHLFYTNLGPAGNDIIDGGAGNDSIFGDDGNDTLSGGLGNDTIEGNAGSDTLNGNDGNDVLFGGAGTNTINGGAGNDHMYSDGPGTFDGGADYDTFSLDLSATTTAINIDVAQAASAGGATMAPGIVVRNTEGLYIVAGSGNDTYTLNAPLVLGPVDQGNLSGSFHAGGGDDLVIADLFSATAMLSVSTDILGFVQGSAGITLTGVERLQIIAGNLNDTMLGGSGSDVLHGGLGDDRVDGGLGNDIVNGGDGNDIVYWSGGVDQIDGGAGTDGVWINFRYTTTAVNISTAGFAGPGAAVLANGTTIQNVEGLAGATLGDANDTLTIVGSPILGTHPQFDGGGGVDTLILDWSASSTALGFGGFYFGVTRFDNFEFLTAYGSALGDGIGGGGLSDTIYGNGGADTIDGGDGPDSLYGGADDDVMRGGVGAFADLLDGGTGADRMEGGDGNDTYYVDNEFDDVRDYANAGTDEVRTTVSYGLAATSTGYFIENLVLLSGAVVGTGNDLANIITGNSDNNVLLGLEGADTLSGGNGNDVLDGGSGADIMNAGEGDDVVYYDAADNAANVQGGGGTDILAFTSGGPPVGFSLSAHGFELAEGRFVVTGATFTDYYDGQWRLSHEIGEASNGSSWFIDWDETSSAPYQRLNQDFDATGQLTREYGLADNGSTWNQFFDTDGTHPYVSILQVHTAGGIYANEHGINDNGSTWDTFFDVDGTNPFQWIQQVRDANGVLAQEEGLADSGTSWFTDYDETGATDYVFYQNVYDTLDRLSFQSGEYDTGFTWTIDYDETETQAWTSIRNDYDDQGVLIGTTTIWDGP